MSSSQGLVRKRVVPFIVADTADTHAVNVTGTFDVLSDELKNKYLNDALNSANDADLSERVQQTQIQVGAKLFRTEQSTKMTAIGEVVALDTTHKIGLALVNLEALYTTVGNFAVINVPKSDSGAEGEADEQSSAASTTSVNVHTMLAEGKVGYISTFRPDWFEGLDVKTGKQRDE